MVLVLFSSNGVTLRAKKRGRRGVGELVWSYRYRRSVFLSFFFLLNQQININTKVVRRGKQSITAT